MMDHPTTCLAFALDDGMIARATRVRRAVTARESRVICGGIVVVLLCGLTTFGSGLSHAFTHVAAHL